MAPGGSYKGTQSPQCGDPEIALKVQLALGKIPGGRVPERGQPQPWSPWACRSQAASAVGEVPQSVTPTAFLRGSQERGTSQEPSQARDPGPAASVDHLCLQLQEAGGEQPGSRVELKGEVLDSIPSPEEGGRGEEEEGEERRGREKRMKRRRRRRKRQRRRESKRRRRRREGGEGDGEGRRRCRLVWNQDTWFQSQRCHLGVSFSRLHIFKPGLNPLTLLLSRIEAASWNFGGDLRVPTIVAKVTPWNS